MASFARYMPKYGSGDPANYIKDRIIDTTGIYLMRSPVNFLGEVSYGVPERLQLLMRSLFSLFQKQGLTDGERRFAQEAFESHRASLVAGEPNITTLEVNPLAPAVVQSRLGRGVGVLAEITLSDDADLLVEYVDGNYGNNIAVTGDIDLAHIRVANMMPVTEEHLLMSVYSPADWTTRIP